MRALSVGCERNEMKDVAYLLIEEEENVDGYQPYD